MDSLTHILVGVLIGTCAKKIPGLENDTSTLLIVSTASSFIPDIDVVTKVFGEKNYLNIHRRFTHQLPVLPILAFVVPLILFSNTKSNFLLYYIISFIAVLSHLLLDILNPYGTKVVPFYKHIKFNFLSTVDPFFLIIICLNIFVIFKYNIFYYLFLILAYIFLRLLIYLFIKKELIKKYKPLKVFIVSMYNPFKWHVIMEFEKHFIIGSFYTKLINSEMILKTLLDDSDKYLIRNTKEFKTFTALADFYVPIIKVKNNYKIIKLIDLKYRKKDYFYFQLIYYIKDNKIINSKVGFIFSDKKNEYLL